MKIKLSDKADFWKQIFTFKNGFIFIPNLDSQFKHDLIKWVHNYSPSFNFNLDYGWCNLTYAKIYEMLRSIEGEGNNYVLLCGATCYNDIILWSDKFSLKELNIILVYDYIIPKERAYLIPLKSYKPLEMSKKFCLFTRE